MPPSGAPLRARTSSISNPPLENATSQRNPGALKAGIPFRGASPTLLTPPGKFKGELCGHLKTVTLGPALGKLFFFFLSKIVHLLVEIVRERSKPLRRYLFGGTKISKDEP